LKILITGSSGFVGSRLVEHFHQTGFSVRGSGRSLQSLDSQKSLSDYFQGDISDFNTCLNMVQGIDCIIHCAGKVGTWGLYQEYYEANVVGTENLLKAAKSCGVKRFINLSTPSIYLDFKDKLNIQEHEIPSDFSNAYAQTKYLAEEVVEAFHGNDMYTLSLRPRLIIGAGDTNVLPRLLRLSDEGKLKKVGTGENIVTVTTMKNLIHAIDLCIKAPKSAYGEAYNIGNAEPVNFWDFVNEVLNKFDKKKVETRLPFFVAFSLARVIEFFAKALKIKKEPAILPVPVAVLAKSMTLDISKAKERLGYNPIFDARDGINEFYDSVSLK